MARYKAGPPLKRPLLKGNWVLIFLGSMSVLLGAIAFVSALKSMALVNEGGTASGTVVRMEYSSGGSGKRNSGAYYPVVHFRSNDGQEVEGRGSLGSSPPSYHQGQEVRVFYEKSNPKNWCIDNWWDLYFFSLIFGIFSAVLAIVSSVMIFLHIQHQYFPGTHPRL